MTGPRRATADSTQPAAPRRPGRRLALGLAGIAVLAPAATAAAAPPDLIPFVPSEGGLAQSRWFVDTSVAGGVYSAKYHFPTQVVNLGGRLKIGAGAAGGPPEAPVAAAVQTVDGGAQVQLGPAVRLVGIPFGGGAYGWGIDGLAKYTLTPVAGPAVDSALAPTCREDNAVFAEPGAPAAGPAEFAPAGTPIGGSVNATANCAPLDGAATGFSSGISTGWQDIIDVNSANTAYFEIAGVAPGEGTFRARVDPSGVIAQGGATGNDTDLRPFDVPGVVANPKSAVLTAAGKASLQLSAQVVEPQVRGRRVTASSPANGSDAAPATSAVRFSVATPPTRGTATVTTGGAVSYDSAGAPVADTFTVVAEDSRGLRSAPAKVFIDPPGSTPRVGLGRPDVTKTVLRRTLRLGAGQARSFAVKVPKGQKRATFSASWNGGTFTISLRKPGTKKEIRKNARGIKLQKARTFRSFAVTSPKPGVWRFTVARKAGGPRTATVRIRATLLRTG
jgi:hypothetical protein